MTAAGLSDERRERAADCGHEQHDITQEQHRTGTRHARGPTASPLMW